MIYSRAHCLLLYPILPHRPDRSALITFFFMVLIDKLFLMFSGESFDHFCDKIIPASGEAKYNSGQYTF